MAGRIRDEDLRVVRERSPVDEVIGEYIQLRNAGGGSLKGLCPFHDEKSPSFNVTPSRGLWYCLAGETRVITDRGTRPIRELAGGTHRVLGRRGDWVEAPFYSFGRQRLMKITLGRNRQTKEIYATPEHRWFVRAGQTAKSEREVLTRDLKPRHRLVAKYPRCHIRTTTPSPFGIAHGITFGDGTRLGTGSMAELDSVKDIELLKWFPVSFTSEHGRQIRVHHLPAFFKALPSLDESPSYLYGWLAGYLAADGCVAADGTVMLSCADRETLEFVRTVCTRLGIGTYGITEQVREGFPGRVPSSLFRVHFVNEDLTEDFFLLGQHLDRFAGATKAYARRGWVVKSVEETERIEEVYCAVVDDGHAFVLEDNILTGNCFGCAEGGDVISFVQKIDHVTFTDAVEHLAARAGVQLRYEEGGYVPGRDRGERTRLVEAHRMAAEFYAEQLASGGAEIGRRFLTERGFERADAERFGVGYAPAEWEALVRHLRGRGFTDKELIRSGLAKEGRRGPMDRFRGRLMWPIRDLSGDIIAFGARRLAENDDGPKYLNTPETPLFHKGAVLYGADLAKKEIARQRQAVIVEGYTDVMACHLAGVPTAVATCGTSFGDDHIKVLRRLLMDSGELRGEVIFTFDGDSAGQRAALRAFADEQKFVTQTFVAVQRDGLDPCDLRIKQGDAAVRDLVASRTPLFEFAVREVMGRYDLTTAEGQIAALDAAAPIVASIKDRGIRQRYAVNLDRWLGIMDERFVLRRVSEHAKRRAREGAPARNGEAPAQSEPRAEAPRPPQEPVNPVVAQVEGELLKLAIQRPGLLGPAFDAVPATMYTYPPHAAIRALIAECGGVTAAGEGWVNGLREGAADETVRDLVTRYAVEPSRTDGDPDERYAASLLARLREIPLSRELTSAKGTLQRLNPVDNPDEYNAQFARLIALEQELRAVREQGIGTL